VKSFSEVIPLCSFTATKFKIHLIKLENKFLDILIKIKNLSPHPLLL